MLSVMLIVALVLTFAYLGIVIFLVNGLLSLPPSGEPQGAAFSVVIAAHNEAGNIGACLQSVLAQSIGAGRYEVIVVDDRSSDGTAEIARTCAGERLNVHVMTIAETPRGASPKKWAVSQGIARARNEIVVFTDADCRVPSTWLETIDKNLSTNVALVQGITTYEKVPGMNPHFFGLQAVDFLSHGIVSAAAIGAGLPLNSNANNFAVRREVFADVGGYGEAEKVISGDDDLLLQRVSASSKWTVRYMTDPAGAVTTAPTTTLRGLLEQRKRWASKTVHYNGRQVALLSTVFGFYLVTGLSFLAGPFYPPLLIAAAGMLGVKMYGESLLMTPGTRIFGQTALRRYILPASVLQLAMVLYAVVGGVFGRFVWKGQRFRRTAEPPRHRN